MNPINELLTKALSEQACFKHPVAVVIETSTQYILGWNGAPTNTCHEECLRKGLPSGEGMNLCSGIHAERRAISHAAKEGIKTDKGTIYMNEWFPCADCAKSIIEAGIVRLVTPNEIYTDKESRILIPKLQNQSYNFEMAGRLMEEAGVEVIIDSSIKLA